MSTQRQIDANRLNALQSTGPRTAQGKATSSQNALKSGLDADSQFVIGESRQEFAELQDEYTARFLPRTPDERFLVDTLIRNEWQLRRLFRVEAQLWEYHTLRASRSEGVPLGEAFGTASDVFMRLHRRVSHAERSYKEALRDLQRLQSARQSAPAPADPLEHAEPYLPTVQPQPIIDQTPKLASFLTFPSEAAPLPPPSSLSPPPGLTAELRELNDADGNCERARQ